ncbi:MAG: E3 ubiquitin ligase family protein [Gammaproteobacteria bacterium]|nr:E3 ubiquitin ligase family protein [Gammaproteobacteria bacterium]
MEFFNPNFWVPMVRSADPAEFWFWNVLLMLASAGGFYAAFRFFKRARIIEDTPTSKVRSAAQGYVELIGIGRMMEGDAIQAPLTNKPCTWWAYKIEEKIRSYSRRGGSRTRWSTIDKRVSHSIFILQDDTGKCVVDPERAEVTHSMEDVWYGNTAQPENGPGAGSVFGGRYRYTEHRMHDGDPLYAIGFFETKRPIETFNKSHEMTALLSKWKRDKKWMLQYFDKNQDGEIDMEEWEKARTAARKIVNAKAQEKALDPGINIMMRPPDGRPYILSVLPQESMARRLRWMAAGGLAAFFLCGIAAVILTNAWFMKGASGPM